MQSFIINLFFLHIYIDMSKSYKLYERWHWSNSCYRYIHGSL